MHHFQRGIQRFSQAASQTPPYWMKDTPGVICPLHAVALIRPKSLGVYATLGSYIPCRDQAV